MKLQYILFRKQGRLPDKFDIIRKSKPIPILATSYTNSSNFVVISQTPSAIKVKYSF